MNTFLLLFTIGMIGFINSLEEEDGHLKPLGYQKKSEGHIDITSDILDPKTFFDTYVKGSKPLVFKGAAKHIPAYHLWTDDYLSNEFGNVVVDIEEGKKENRSLGAWNWPLKQFIEKYKKDDVYMVHTLPKEMARDLRLLPCLSCGGFSNVLQMLVMWFSSGGTKSVLHNDAIDNINCLFSGTKSLYMVDKDYFDLTHFDVPEASHSNVNVDAVDLKKYPNFSKVPWWEAKMEAGDCLFIPYKWIHQVRSSADETSGRNMAVNIWFYHLRQFNTSDCDGKKSHDFLPFDGLEISNSNINAVRSLLLFQLENNHEISNKNMFKRLREYYLDSGVRKADLMNIKGLLDKDKNKKVSVNEIKDLTDEELKAISIIFPGLYHEEEGLDELPEDDGFEGEKENEDVNESVRTNNDNSDDDEQDGSLLETDKVDDPKEEL